MDIKIDKDPSGQFIDYLTKGFSSRLTKIEMV